MSKSEERNVALPSETPHEPGLYKADAGHGDAAFVIWRDDGHRGMRLELPAEDVDDELMGFLYRWLRKKNRHLHIIPHTGVDSLRAMAFGAFLGEIGHTLIRLPL